MKDSFSHAARRGSLDCLCLIALLSTAAWASPQADPPQTCCTSATAVCCETSVKADLEAKWGIQITTLRLSARGAMIDFRYKVLDPVKAAELANPELHPVLTEEATGFELHVPNTPKAGPLRQSAEQLEAGKIYWMFFSNLSRAIKSGSQVTVTIGDFKVEHLTIE